MNIIVIESKRTAALIVIFLLSLAAGGITVYASEEFDLQRQYEASGAGSAFDNLPGSVREELANAGIDAGNISTAENINPAGVMNSVISMAGEEIQTPLSALGVIIALLLFASVMKGGESAVDSPVSPSLNAVVSLAVGITLVMPCLCSGYFWRCHASRQFPKVYG